MNYPAASSQTPSPSTVNQICMENFPVSQMELELEIIKSIHVFPATTYSSVLYFIPL